MSTKKYKKEAFFIRLFIEVLQEEFGYGILMLVDPKFSCSRSGVKQTFFCDKNQDNILKQAPAQIDQSALELTWYRPLRDKIVHHILVFESRLAS